MSRRKDANKLLATLSGRTITEARVEGSHGDVLILTLNGSTEVRVCTILGTEHESPDRCKEDLYISVDGREAE